MSESISTNLGQSEPAPLEAGAIGCVCSTEGMVGAVSAQLLKQGVAADAIHVGAADAARAGAAAQTSGIRADVQADDPLRGLIDLGDEGAARRAVDRGGVIGALAGAVGGFALSFTSVGLLIPVPHSVQPLASCLFFFVVGLIAGSVLGAAFAPQQSSHAGFRLIDGMADGAFALIVVAPRSRLDEVQHVFEMAGGVGITRL